MDFFDVAITIGIIVAKSVLLLVALLVFVAYILYADRKIWAAVQLRRGFPRHGNRSRQSRSRPS